MSEYYSAIYVIVNKLNILRETRTNKEMFEKIFTNFYLSQVVIQQQYHERNFQKYDDLIFIDTVKKHSELLLKKKEVKRALWVLKHSLK